MELRTVLAAFLIYYNVQLAKILDVENWSGRLVYLNHMFNKINEMDLSVQVKTAIYFYANEKVSSYRETYVD